MSINAHKDDYSRELGKKLLSDLTCGYTIGGAYANLKDQAYVHVVLSKKSSSSEHDYFKVNDSTNTGTNKNGNGGQQQAKPAQ